MKKNGFTIVELLIVIAISMILAGAMYSFYSTIVRENITRSITAKKQQDVYIFLNQIFKDLSSIGFGVDRNRLKINGGNTCPLDNNNPFLTRCSSGNNDQLYFISLASRSEANSGCWGFIDNNGNLIIPQQVSSYTLKPCSPVNSNYLLLDQNKNPNGIYNPAIPDPSKKNSYAFYIGYKAYPDDFVVHYYMDSTKLPSECAPGTYNLMRQVGSDVASPVVSCVLNFKVRYVDMNSNISESISDINNVDMNSNISESISDINNLNAIKICMIMQVGGRQTTQETPPNYSSSGGCSNFDFSTNPDWRYYRWVVVEQTIPLLNIR